MVMLVQKVSGIAVSMIKNMSGKLTVINDIDLESYIKGVVPSEMPASWEFEALKAQAIAASFALANLVKQSRNGYDLKDNTEDQAYGGASAETNITNKAVDETHGLVLTYDMKIISAYYFASAGRNDKYFNLGWRCSVSSCSSVI